MWYLARCGSFWRFSQVSPFRQPGCDSVQYDRSWSFCRLLRCFSLFSSFLVLRFISCYSVLRIPTSLIPRLMQRHRLSWWFLTNFHWLRCWTKRGRSTQNSIPISRPCLEVLPGIGMLRRSAKARSMPCLPLWMDYFQGQLFSYYRMQRIIPTRFLRCWGDPINLMSSRIIPGSVRNHYAEVARPS